jgi:hypothetical protein
MAEAATASIALTRFSPVDWVPRYVIQISRPKSAAVPRRQIPYQSGPDVAPSKWSHVKEAYTTTIGTRPNTQAIQARLSQYYPRAVAAGTTNTLRTSLVSRVPASGRLSGAGGLLGSPLPVRWLLPDARGFQWFLLGRIVRDSPRTKLQP